MAAYDRRTFAGGAIATTITADINGSATSIGLAATSGWPTGSAGEFGVIIDRGTASEEKVLIASRSGSTLTVTSGGRGVDGTSATTHSAGATIEVCIFARDVDEPNAHLADDTLDHHSQYLNTARHDVEARHTFGAALGTPVAPASIGTSNSAGTGDNPAREDHVHEIGTGAIDTAAMFAAGVIDAAALGTGAVTSAKILDGTIAAGDLADGAVTTAKIGDDQVTAAKIADGAIDAAAKFAAGVVDAAAIAANAVGSSELADNAVDTAAIADGAVTTVKGATTWPRGVVGEVNDTTTVASFAALTPTCAQLDDVSLITGRSYHVMILGNARSDAADTVVDLALEQRLDAGAWTGIEAFRGTCAVASGASSTITINGWATFEPGSTGTYDFRIVGSRVTGSGTITMARVKIKVVDEGLA